MAVCCMPTTISTADASSFWLEWDLDGFDLQPADFEPHFRPVANAYGIKYHLVLNSYRPKVAILVSGFDH